MKVGCSGKTHAGFPIGINLIEDPSLSIRSFDLGADFWNDDNFDTIVHVTARYGLYDSSGGFENANNYSILSFSIHRQKVSEGGIITRINGNTDYSRRTLNIALSSSNVITKGSTTHTIEISGVFIEKTNSPISWNYPR